MIYIVRLRTKGEIFLEHLRNSRFLCVESKTKLGSLFQCIQPSIHEGARQSSSHVCRKDMETIFAALSFFSTALFY